MKENSTNTGGVIAIALIALMLAFIAGGVMMSSGSGGDVNILTATVGNDGAACASLVCINSDNDPVTTTTTYTPPPAESRTQSDGALTLAAFLFMVLMVAGIFAAMVLA
jgi:hypothetical protein